MGESEPFAPSVASDTTVSSGPPRGLRRPWTRERVARLGLLAGMGFTAKAIAADPLVASTPGNVYRQALRFGIALSDVPQGQFVLRLPADTKAFYDCQAQTHGMTTPAFLRRLLILDATDASRMALLVA